MSLLNKICLLLLFSALCVTNSFGLTKLHEVKIEPEFAVVKGMEAEIKLSTFDSLGNAIPINCFSSVYVNDEKIDIYFNDGLAVFDYTFEEPSLINIKCAEVVANKEINPIPLWLSILPPLIAILVALLFKEVFSALFLGLFSGTLIIYLHSGVSVFSAFFKSIFSIVDKYVIEALSEPTHISIIVFSMLIGGTVHIITKNGGMQGVISVLSKYAKTARSGQLVTWVLGLLVFFDDYANTLVVGNTMRPVTDKLRVSREKLAYIVDSTAAPVASIAFVTTWIGAELSYIQSTLVDLQINESAYNIFFASLKYSFYPILALVFVFLLIWSRRDFGPMYHSEKRARSKGVNVANLEKKIEHDLKEFESERKIKPRVFNALIPIAVIVFGTIGGLFYTGWDVIIWNDDSLSLLTKMSGIIGNSDSYKSLIWASLSGLLVAIVLSLVQKLLRLKEVAEGMIAGFKTMLTAILILTLAWSLAGLIGDLHTADFITLSISSTNMSPQFLPFVSFLVSGLIAFSTGSSWGTMAIMYPLILPAAWSLSGNAGLPYDESIGIFAHVVSTVIAGSVFGDHCSPISDTTILSSLASSCNHIQHVKTQLPYAITVAIVALVIGTLPIAYGVSAFVLYPAMIIVAWLIIRFVGKKTEPEINIGN
ncbi:MAG: Na+/H+ antiporter NhaC family protein [Bacteroidales bacterium]|nr:Na+/H+ antiporter NhaC family protein [Bacteroidales bacterium]